MPLKDFGDESANSPRRKWRDLDETDGEGGGRGIMNDDYFLILISELC